VKIAILGCGLIGEKRGKQVGENEIVGVFDPIKDRARRLGTDLGAKVFESEDDLIQKSNADIVIVAAINRQLAPLALKCVKAGKHVLVEKPAAISVTEISELEAAAKSKGVAVKVGFNPRFHPALLKARDLIDQGSLGDLMFARGRYGHGARLGYETEWRNIPEMGGGGELLDQGVHMLDLIYWFFGPLPLQSSYVTTSFWNMKVDDNAVLTVADKKCWANFHVSCSEWKNTFALEIYGREGKILVAGLGRSYGTETLTYYKMSPKMGPPESQTFQFDQEDRSWELDMKNLIAHLRNKTPLWGDLNSAKYALEQVRAAYRVNGFTKLPCSV